MLKKMYLLGIGTMFFAGSQLFCYEAEIINKSGHRVQVKVSYSDDGRRSSNKGVYNLGPKNDDSKTVEFHAWIIIKVNWSTDGSSISRSVKVENRNCIFEIHHPGEYNTDQRPVIRLV